MTSESFAILTAILVVGFAVYVHFVTKNPHSKKAA